MSDKNRMDAADSAATSTSPSPRVAFEKLRERTDELELLISGISLLALIALPNWLFDHWMRYALHLEGERLAVVLMVFPLAIGLSYSLAGAFLLHLAVRAYWVGLIGLKAVFPDGIRWQSLRSLGPIARQDQQRRLVDLETSIGAADRVASIIFAMISLVALSIMWMGSLLLGIILLGMFAGYLFGLPEGSVDDLVSALALVFIGMPILATVLDRGMALLRGANAAPPAWLQKFVRALISVQSVFMPQRLMLPVQLTLESNLPRYTFTFAFAAILFSTVLIGVSQPRLAKQFAPFGDYAYLDEMSVANGLRSASYENLRVEEDRLLHVPMIPSDLVADSFLRVFLPYVPDRDNQAIRDQCADTTTAALRLQCLARLWTVSLDGVPVDISSFIASERRDIGLRGIQGYLALAGLAPGAHQLTVTWASTADSADESEKAVYQIPFWFAPPYQLDLPTEMPVEIPVSAERGAAAAENRSPVPSS
ncbi:hypothetical protein [Dokdonella sp.]|uniref:hypothetical protein n=1 Tax=Dokdonella sp. TaxID=2291710 RepID=UPI003C487D17